MKTKTLLHALVHRPRKSNRRLHLLLVASPLYQQLRNTRFFQGSLDQICSRSSQKFSESNAPSQISSSRGTRLRRVGFGVTFRCRYLRSALLRRVTSLGSEVNLWIGINKSRANVVARSPQAELGRHAGICRVSVPRAKHAEYRPRSSLQDVKGVIFGHF